MKVVSAIAILILLFHKTDTQQTYYIEEKEQTLSCPANTTNIAKFELSLDEKVFAVCQNITNEFKCDAMFKHRISRNKSGFHVIIPEQSMPTKMVCKYDHTELHFNIRKIDKPSMPRNITVTNITAETAALSWAEPEDNGGKLVKGYILEKSDASRQIWTGLAEVADSAPFDVKGLVAGEKYIFRIAAENDVGVGKFAESDIITAKNPFDVPDAPDAPVVKEVFKDNVFLAWQPPANDGGTSVTGYIVERQSNITSSWIAVNKEPVSGTEVRVMDLVENNTYQFRVIALNKAGPSKPSESSTTVKAKDPYNKPSMPRNVTVTNITAETAALSWAEPEDNGGKLVKGYILEKSDASRQIWTGLAEVADSAPFDVKGLVEGEKYIFRIAAENDVGVGKFAESDIITAKNPFDVPDAPDAPVVKEVVKDNVFLAWQPPANDGGTSVTGYIVERQSNITSSWIAVNKEPVSGTEVRVMDLVEDNTYQFRVIALNKAGPSKPSQPSTSVKAKDPYNKPSMPRNVTVTNITAETAALSWAEPEDNGGKPVKGYILEKSDASRQIWTGLAEVAHSAPFDVKGLVDGEKYIFRIAAENDVGVGKFAESDIITAKNPFDVPDAPDAPVVKEVFKDNVFLAWQPPVNDGGTSVTGYIVERQSNITSSWIAVNKEPVSGTEVRVMDLVEDNTYQFRVIALNKAGPSKPSEPSTSVKAKDPYNKPSMPRNVTVTNITAETAALSWAEPEDNGSKPVKGYILEKSDASRQIWTGLAEVAHSAPFDVNCLVDGEKYIFRIAAENDVGVGKFAESDIITAKNPFDVPDAPDAPVVKEVFKDNVFLAWQPPVNDGGTSVTGYIVERQSNITSSWIAVNKEPVSGTEVRVMDLVEDNTYQFRVIALNKAGPSKPSEPSTSVKAKDPYNKPSMPRNVTMTNITAETAALSWAEPEDNGGKPVKGYILEKSDASRQIWTGLAEVADSAPFDVKGLVDGEKYIFRIAAENDVGVGKFAESDIITAKNPFDVPDAPDAPVVKEVFKENVFLAWQPPANDGGTSVTGYIVERQSNITSSWIAVNKEPVSGTEVRVMDLVEDNTYQFRVIALNKAGPSKPSEPSTSVKAKDPYNKPSMPRNVTVTNITAETAALSWAEPEDNGGKPVKGYILEKSDASRQIWTGLAEVADSAPFDVKGLVDGEKYIFRIAAENDVGVGKFADSDIITAKNPFVHVGRRNNNIKGILWGCIGAGSGVIVLAVVLHIVTTYIISMNRIIKMCCNKCASTDLEADKNISVVISAKQDDTSEAPMSLNVNVDSKRNNQKPEKNRSTNSDTIDPSNITVDIDPEKLFDCISDFL